MLKDKGLIIGIIATVILITGGVFLMSRGSSGSSSSSTGSQVSSDILIPKGDYETSGIENGTYLPVTPSAKVTLVEFGDYQCPACVAFHPLVKELLTDLAGKVNYVFRNFPLSQHENAKISAYAAEAAGLQGKYWQMHDKLYESAGEWSTAPDAKSIFVGYAQAMGLDINKFTTDIDSSVVKDKVQNDINDGSLVNLNATPTFYLNGIKLQNLQGDYADFKKQVSGQL